MGLGSSACATVFAVRAVLAELLESASLFANHEGAEDVAVAGAAASAAAACV